MQCKVKNQMKDIVVCPQDVKECPDGTFVSRDPFNNCEFGLCADEFEGASDEMI